MSLTPHITVCICTYKRVQLLENLLFALEVQRTDGLFSFSAVVVDNDGTESAGNMVGRAGKEVKYRIEYYVEPRQNIALARNRAVLNAEGDFIAMIDDDESPNQRLALPPFSNTSFLGCRWRSGSSKTSF